MVQKILIFAQLSVQCMLFFQAYKTAVELIAIPLMSQSPLVFGQGCQCNLPWGLLQSYYYGGKTKLIDSYIDKSWLQFSLVLN